MYINYKIRSNNWMVYMYISITATDHLLEDLKHICRA